MLHVNNDKNKANLLAERMLDYLEMKGFAVIGLISALSAIEVTIASVESVRELDYLGLAIIAMFVVIAVVCMKVRRK